MSFFSSLRNKESAQPLTDDDEQCYRSVESGQLLPQRDDASLQHESALSQARNLLKEKAHALRRQRCLVGTAAVSALALFVVLVLVLIISAARRHS